MQDEILFVCSSLKEDIYRFELLRECFVKLLGPNRIKILVGKIMDRHPNYFNRIRNTELYHPSLESLLCRLKSEISQLGLFKNIVKKANSSSNSNHQLNGYGGTNGYGSRDHEQQSFFGQQRQLHHEEEEDDDCVEDDDDDSETVLVSPDICSVSIDD